MVINVKYYVITIVAIFLAIGIGIFIGIMLDGQDLIVKQQADILKQVEDRFDEFKIKQDELQESIAQLNNENENNVKFLNTIFPNLVKGRLKDYKVMIIETSEHISYSEIDDTLQQSGVENISKLIIKDKFFTLENDQSEEVEGENTEKLNINQLLNSILTEKNEDIIKKSIEDEIIQLNGQTNMDFDYIILAGEDNESLAVFESIEKPIISFCKDNNMEIVAVEKSNSDISKIKEYKKLGLSTVDNIDTTMGKISLVMLLTGESGNYGQKKTADKVAPQWFKE
ncbi:copper transporter [Anaeromicrobium sediminis]|uniref:Copper transporter n=1 Tax=Anaeromicrobium sediminis TaxID=1478221 RepID=A0A267MNM8_9FIRM|nr:copper transporter [Anaeromicrobium sediminis]PAB61204.1 hypothetical protein CCE28_01905 [Anaeromicrobium sediminis]